MHTITLTPCILTWKFLPSVLISKFVPESTKKKIALHFTLWRLKKKVDIEGVIILQCKDVKMRRSIKFLFNDSFHHDEL